MKTKTIELTGQRLEMVSASISAALDHGVDIVGRRVFLYGDVGEFIIGRAVRGLYMLAHMNRDEPIELYVTSYGGDLDDAYALHDVVRTVPAPVHVIALGKCMSAAPMIVACGAKGQRWATENCTFMLHATMLASEEDDLSTPVALQAQVDEAVRATKRYAQLLGRYTHKTTRFWQRMFEAPADRFFDADQALEWGIVDQIWTGWREP